MQLLLQDLFRSVNQERNNRGIICLVLRLTAITDKPFQLRSEICYTGILLQTYVQIKYAVLFVIQ
jgi:hypothetical protein